MKTVNFSESEQLYLDAKRSYYLGTPIMSDDEFDILESELISQNSSVMQIVGFDDDDRNAKFNHPSPMLSLAKYQASTEGKMPTAQAMAWMQDRNAEYYEATPKFDGNAINVIYRNNPSGIAKREAILSRGNGTAGRDYTKKLFSLMPESIRIIKEIHTIEIRGEIIIPKEIFDAKYSKYKNERNFVAGILNRDESFEADVIDDFVFMAVEIRFHPYEDSEFSGMFFGNIEKHFPEWGFNKKVPLLTYLFTPAEFENTYKTMLHYREHESPVRLDGFVIKTPEKMRVALGENAHDPNWAVAIKFPPQIAKTTIKDIQWKLGKTGEFTPVAIMTPTPLDGTVVSRATLFNYGYIKEKRAFPGAVVTIVKSGDIIPQIVSVLIPSENNTGWHPTTCIKCNHQLAIDGLHLICPNYDCVGKKYHKFIQGFNYLGIDGSGGAMIKKLWEAGFTSPLDVLDKTKFTKRNLIASKFFKEGKTLNSLFERVNAIKEIPINRLLMMLAFEGMGNSTAKVIGDQIAGNTFDTKGLEKSVIEGFGENGKKRAIVIAAIEHLNANGIMVIMPQSNTGGITFEMTGSPKMAGFKTKEDFVKFMKDKGYRATNLKEASILVTDDLTSTSSKMKEAKNKGKKIMSYSEFI